MSIELIAILMFGLMIVILLTGRHIFAVVGGIATIFALALWGAGGEGMPFYGTFTLLRWYPLLTLPSFIFMGYILSRSGLAERLYRAFHVWMGPIKGGLAIGTIGLSTLIAAMNGLSVAGMVITGTIALPEMLKRKYDKLMVTGVIQAGSSLGILIPPSIVLILYGMIARQPIGRLWLGGVFPGLLLAGMFIAYISIRCQLQPHLGPPLPLEERQVSWGEKFRLLWAGLPPIIIIFAVLGLFFMGITSLVESSAIGAVGALVAAAINRQLTWKVFTEALDDTVRITGLFMWIVLAAIGFGAVFDGLGAVNAVESMFLGFGLGPLGIIVMMQASFILMGMVLDDTAMLLIVAPLYIPLVDKLGFDLIWYGVLYTITCQMAYLTPPFGYNLFLMKAVAPKEITLGDIYRSVIPFVAILGICLAVIMLFPQIALWLPNFVMGQ